MEIDWYTGPRMQLRALFEHAEDSHRQLDRYLNLGRVLVARRGPRILGHLQLVPADRSRQIELKNMAIMPQERGIGVGRALVEAAIHRCAAEGWSRMIVATAAADTRNLRFYQRLGFRMLRIERDVFGAEAGYADGIVINGIPLCDRVWLNLDLSGES